ncbi:winged helix-turn-helix domain-containing protein [Streptomyces sp. HUAS ZL42]|uniref:AfsR/SARP family transcriptional regulator n=1 Tax=Streptomyces sp. HUAS ZL42 TaxID=3231715 RepID=UPI00345F11BF
MPPKHADAAAAPPGPRFPPSPPSSPWKACSHASRSAATASASHGAGAALLVDAGRPVPLETLIDRVWGEDPPAEARASLYSHAARLRRTLADATGAEEGTPGPGPAPSRNGTSSR